MSTRDSLGEFVERDAPDAVALAKLSMAYSTAVISARMILEGERLLIGDLTGARVVARHVDEADWVALVEAIRGVLGDG